MDIDKEFNSATGALDIAARKVETATVARNAERDRVQRLGSWQHLNEEGRRVKLEEIDGPMFEAERAYGETSAGMEQKVRALETYAAGSPQPSDGVIARANTLATFVREDVEAARTPDEIARAIDQAVVEGDQARAWLIARYSRQRIDASAGDDLRASFFSEALGKALKQVDGLFADPSRKRASEHANALRKAIRESSKRVRELRGEERQAAALAAMRASGRYSF